MSDPENIACSKELAAFRSGYYEANTWAARKDGPPDYLIDALNEADRVIAEEELLQRLDGSDHWTVSALAKLRSQKAVPKLRNLLLTKSSLRADIATAIYLITGDDSFEYLVIREAKAWSLFPSWIRFTRIDAIHLLANFKTASAFKVLDALCYDKDHLIAYNAKLALKRPTR